MSSLKYLAAAMLTLMAASSLAASRPDSRTMSCGAARQLVMDRGAVVLTTGRHTYDRYVSGQRYCDTGLYAHQASVPTRDRKSCDVGYVCMPSRPFPGD